VSSGKKIAAPNAAAPATPQEMPKERSKAISQAMPPAMAAVTTAQPADKTVTAIQKPEPKAESANPPAQTAAIVPTQPAVAPAPTSPAPEVASDAKAEIALPPPVTLDVAAAPAAPTPGNAREIARAASVSLDDPDNLVALVLAGPGINSLSDLNNKNIAITEKQSASSGRVSAALMAAGAAEVQFSEAKASAIDRLINGEVPAAVVLTPRDVANLFPEVDGFRTFRVPLKARL
jgi:hypothetical protein